MKNKYSQRTQLDLKIFGYYQILGGAAGILFMLWSIYKAEDISVGPIILPFLLFSFSIYCGFLCLDFKKTGLQLSLVNQFMQVVGFAFSGFSFYYVAGVYFDFPINFRIGSDFKFGAGLSLIDLRINTFSFLQQIRINLVAIFLVAMILQTRRRIAYEAEAKQIAELGEN